MEHKFEIGDKVKVVINKDSDYCARDWVVDREGQVARVIEIDDSGMPYLVTFDDGVELWYDEESLVFVNRKKNKTPFRVGDIVKARKPTDEIYYYTTKEYNFVGRVVKIVNSFQIEVEVIWSDVGKGGNGHHIVDSKYFKKVY